MASGIVKLADVIVPSVFDPYFQLVTEEKTNFVQSGAIAVKPQINDFLAGPAVTADLPLWKDLDNDTENISTDDDSSSSTPNKIGTTYERVVRLSRNQSWSAMDLTSQILAEDPMAAIGNRIGAYWARRKQAAIIAMLKGIFADNAAAPSGSDTHAAGDMTVDIKGSSYSAGVTTFSAEAVIDATLTMGDSLDDLGMIFMHSVVYGRALKNNLIDFVQDSANPLARKIPTFLGRTVIVDDAMPVTSGVYDTWLLGPGALVQGIGSAKVPSETFRNPEKGTGAGMETLYTRVEWCIAALGYRYIGTAASGGPSNLATSNNLAAAGSWSRIYPERKQVKIARLITRES